MGRLADALELAEENLKASKANVEKYGAQVATLKRLVKDKAVSDALDEILERRPRKGASAAGVAKGSRPYSCSKCGGEGHRSDSKECPKNAPKKAKLETAPPAPAKTVRPMVSITDLALRTKISVPKLWESVRAQKIETTMIGGVAHLRGEDVDRVKEMCA